jgi:hypothetical protein
MKKTIKTDIGNLYIHDNYMVAEVNEGETVSKFKYKIVIEAARTYYQSKPFIYISNRINSYAVDPIVYKKASEIENLIGFAVVSKKRIALRNTEIESLFSSKPFKLFITMEEALKWVDSMID